MKPEKILLPLAVSLGTIAGLTVFAVAPGHVRRGMDADAFTGRYFAHRGLHNNDKGAPENSVPAFRLASEAGYGAELDVHLTSDGKLAVFHDDTLSRVCGVEGRVEDMTLAQLKALRLCGTDERVPELSEALAALNGAPVIVEIKRGLHNVKLCEKTLAVMDSYRGKWCVESFDPFIVRWFRKNAPDVLRGQLSSPPAELAEGTSRRNAFLVGNLLTNFLARPHFIAYKIGKKPPTVRLCEAMGAIRAAWTSREKGDARGSDVVIFEGYRPDGE